MDIFLSVVQAYMLILAVFGIWHMLGVSRVWNIRHIGGAASAVLLIAAAEILTGHLIFSSEWATGWIFFISWGLIISGIQIAYGIGEEPLEFPHLKSYLTVSSAGMVLFYLLSLIGRSSLRVSEIALWSEFFGLLAGGVILGSYVLYFSIYKTAFSADDMLPILQTHVSEVKGYISDQIGIVRFLPAVLCFIIYGGWLFYILFEYPHETVFFTQADRYGLLITALLSLYALFRYGRYCYPFKEYTIARNCIKAGKRIIDNHEDMLNKLKLDERARDIKEGTVILVIGESACRMHMKAFNPDYEEETTPWLSKCKETGRFELFGNAYSNFPQTTPALSMYLTNVNQYEPIEEKSAISVIDAANKGGYKTYWFSNHTKTGKNSFCAAFVGSRADLCRWTDISEGDDLQLLELLKTVPEGGKNFIVLHMMGSHMKYEERVPEGFPEIGEKKEKIKNENKKTAAYDTTLLYTDQVLQAVFEYAEKNLNLQAIIYCSDHGEDMEYGHGTGHFTYDMVRIPLWVYLSEDYKNTCPERYEALHSHKEAIFTNDLMYDTVCGILGTANNFYKKQYDLSDIAYDLPADKALTKHGKIKIAKDPLLKDIK